MCLDFFTFIQENGLQIHLIGWECVFLAKKLYYQNAYLKTFESKVVKQSVDEVGNTYVVLEETAFYPTGGGSRMIWGKLIIRK